MGERLGNSAEKKCQLNLALRTEKELNQQEAGKAF